MEQTAIFWPVIAQIALTYGVYVVMSMRRVRAIRAGEARGQDFKIPKDPELSASAARNVENQFELPVLFYVVCLALYQTSSVDAVTVALAWLFALSRIGHALVHVTTNKIMIRRRVFIAGFFILAAMWILFAWRLALN
ncbi:MAPEG family protein [Oricola cellulosilytica]|uniref:MAPEG family protein n=1 Tax=Oricola cellulosilytica TaxID=1429082 RepID=A0A4R0P8B8_9HYPH|nr:MAPEG family protein [Oricola cellulosilytica]TCD13313.1 hypothetical protein E0D97_12515 [Oricola cellulosilytica]